MLLLPNKPTTRSNDSTEAHRAFAARVAAYYYFCIITHNPTCLSDYSCLASTHTIYLSIYLSRGWLRIAHMPLCAPLRSWFAFGGVVVVDLGFCIQSVRAVVGASRFTKASISTGQLIKLHRVFHVESLRPVRSVQQ